MTTDLREERHFVSAASFNHARTRRFAAMDTPSGSLGICRRESFPANKSTNQITVNIVCAYLSGFTCLDKTVMQCREGEGGGTDLKTNTLLFKCFGSLQIQD